MKPFLHVLTALLLVSCTHFSGKLDTVGQRDAVMDANAVVNERYRVGGKSYVPVTARALSSCSISSMMTTTPNKRSC